MNCVTVHLNNFGSRGSDQGTVLKSPDQKDQTINRMKDRCNSLGTCFSKNFHSGTCV